MSLSQFFSETIPPTPTFTESNLSDLSSKTYLVTGGSSGVGLELCKLLYLKSATIFLLARNASAADAAITSIKAAHPTSTGTLHFVHIDLSDLTTIKAAAAEVLKCASRLDVVWHNAGIMVPPAGSKDAQGHELQLGTNVIAPWLLQHFLTPLMEKTAAMPDTPKRSVRVIWLASSAIAGAPYSGGIKWDDINFEHSYNGVLSSLFAFNGQVTKYAQSKAGNVFLAAEAAKRWSGSGIVSLSVNPGNLRSGLDRSSPWLMQFVLRNFVVYPPYYGALTELFAGLGEVQEGQNGGYVIPWGRFGEVRADIKSALGENGERLWRWCEEECREFM